MIASILQSSKYIISYYLQATTMYNLSINPLTQLTKNKDTHIRIILLSKCLLTIIRVMRLPLVKTDQTRFFLKKELR